MNEETIKILAVDDEEDIRDVVKSYFERKGYDVSVAADGKEALDMIASKHFHCIFADIDMPRMDGLEFARRIRKIDNTLPVVIMTGTPSMESIVHTLRNGVLDYLTKPINFEQMEFTVQKVLRERKILIENLILKEELTRKKQLEFLHNEMQSRLQDVNILNRIMEDFSETDSTHMAYDKVVALGTEQLLADQVFFHLYSQEEEALIQMASRSRDTDPISSEDTLWQDIPQQVKMYLLRLIQENDTPCLINSPGKHIMQENKVHSCMAAPLKIRDKLFGIASAFIFTEDRTFSEKDIYYLNFIAQRAASSIENVALYGNMIENLYATLLAFVTALEARDPYTSQHSIRVARYARDLAEHMGCTQEEIETIDMAGRLHDIGKIGIPDQILLKPGKLTREEYERIKLHPVIGADIIGKLGLWDEEMGIIRYHHERMDGKGYPEGLKGPDIPKLARIVSVADSYDAMASDRSYRNKIKKEDIIKNIHKNSGTQFDPDVVKIFLKRSNSEEWKFIDLLSAECEITYNSDG